MKVRSLLAAIVLSMNGLFAETADPAELARLANELQSAGYDSIKTERLLLEIADNGQFPHMASTHHGHYLGHPRDYWTPLTEDEKKDIRFIIVTLAKRSLLTIAKNRSALEEAGDRIDHVHPLKFLEAIFTDEELKIEIRNVRGRGTWIWGDFLGGLKDSLNVELGAENLNENHVQNLAKLVEVNPTLLWPLVTNKQWDDLMNLLIAQVPRKGNGGRFDN